MSIQIGISETQAMHAIFLSYASQDAAAARRICDAMRAAGLEVWFDQSELRGGDAWDVSIKKQIKECALFVPIISANTEARLEGYFRLEWRLADQRTHLMAKGKPFLVPVAVDDTKDGGAHVPDSFLDVQWTRWADGDAAALEKFAVRVAKLLDGSAPSSINAPHAAPGLGAGDKPASRSTSEASPHFRTGNKVALKLVVVTLIGAGIYVATQSKTTTSAIVNASNDTSKSATINPLSVMVMPFANQTGDKEKAYIADALTSSITSDLSRIRDATIVPDATAFSLADKKLTIPQLGKEAAVRFVLTGTVTGDKDKLRINAVLSDTKAGAQLWTENFDGKQTDLFALQDQVTTRIGNTIGPQMIIVAARESEKRADKPQVADLLMRASALALNQNSLKNHQAMEALYRQALALEPDNLKAKLGLATRLLLQAVNFGAEFKHDQARRTALAKQGAELAQAVKQADPNNPGVYLPIALFATFSGDLEGSVQAARRRVELQPRTPSAYNNLGAALIRIGDMQGAKAALEMALQFTNRARHPGETYLNLARVAFVQDRPDESITWLQQAMDANPNLSYSHMMMALAYARKGDQAQARKAAAEAIRLNPNLQLDIKDDLPWPGKEAEYRKYIETRYLPAWRLAGLPE